MITTPEVGDGHHSREVRDAPRPCPELPSGAQVQVLCRPHKDLEAL